MSLSLSFLVFPFSPWICCRVSESIPGGLAGPHQNLTKERTSPSPLLQSLLQPILLLLLLLRLFLLLYLLLLLPLLPPPPLRLLLLLLHLLLPLLPPPPLRRLFSSSSSPSSSSYSSSSFLFFFFVFFFFLLFFFGRLCFNPLAGAVQYCIVSPDSNHCFATGIKKTVPLSRLTGQAEVLRHTPSAASTTRRRSSCSALRRRPANLSRVW